MSRGHRRRVRPGLIWISRHQATSTNTAVIANCTPMVSSQTDGLWAQDGLVMPPCGWMALRLVVAATAAKPTAPGSRSRPLSAPNRAVAPHRSASPVRSRARSPPAKPGPASRRRRIRRPRAIEVPEKTATSRISSAPAARRRWASGRWPGRRALHKAPANARIDALVWLHDALDDFQGGDLRDADFTGATGWIALVCLYAMA
jgi:hypothetical protein